MRQFDTKGFTFNAMTMRVANDYMKLAERRGRLAASVAQDLKEAADNLLSGEFEYCGNRLQSVMTATWTVELAQMDAQLGIYKNLLYHAVVNDENVGRDEYADAVTLLHDQIVAKFNEFREFRG